MTCVHTSPVLGSLLTANRHIVCPLGARELMGEENEHPKDACMRQEQLAEAPRAHGEEGSHSEQWNLGGVELG